MNEPMRGLHGPRKAEALLHEFAHAATLPGFRMPPKVSDIMDKVSLACPTDKHSEVRALAAELPLAVRFGFAFDTDAWLDFEAGRQNIMNLRRRVYRYMRTTRSKRQQQKLRQLLRAHLDD